MFKPFILLSKVPGMHDTVFSFLAYSFIYFVWEYFEVVLDGRISYLNSFTPFTFRCDTAYQISELV